MLCIQHIWRWIDRNFLPSIQQISRSLLLMTCIRCCGKLTLINPMSSLWKWVGVELMVQMINQCKLKFLYNRTALPLLSSTQPLQLKLDQLGCMSVPIRTLLSCILDDTSNKKLVNPGQTCKEAFKHFDIWNLYVWLGSISDINCKMLFKTKYQTTFWLQMMFIAATSFYTWSVIFKQCSENWLKITCLKIQKTTKTKLFSGCLFHTNILSSLSFPNSKYFYVL